MAREIKTNQPLTKLQKRIISAVTDDRFDTIVIKTGRQCAKTTTSILLCLSWATNKAGTRIGFFEPTYKQCRKVIEQIKSGLGEHAKGFVDVNLSTMIITFNNGSYIQFLSAEGEVRGFTFDNIVVDEAAFIQDDKFKAEIEPTVGIALGKGGKMVIISTPKKKNWFFSLCHSNDPKTCVITATTYEGELWSKEIIDRIKKQAPDIIFRNEYLAEFVDDASTVFEYKGAISEISKSKQGCVAGLDFGIDGDYTALSIVNSSGELVYINRWNGVKWEDLLDTVTSVLKEYQATCYAESNGIGNMPTQTLQSKWHKTNKWVTTNQTKVDIITKLATDLKTGELKIPDYAPLLNEFDTYALEYTPKTGKLTFNARSGHNDDLVMSLAIANYHRGASNPIIVGYDNTKNRRSRPQLL